MSEHDFKPGDRVGVTVAYDRATAYSLGYGKYLGSFIPKFEVKCEPSQMLKPISREVFKNNENPVIELDSGEYVWGLECVWMSEQDYKQAETEIRHEIVSLGPLRERRMIANDQLNYDTRILRDEFKVDFTPEEPLILD